MLCYDNLQTLQFFPEKENFSLCFFWCFFMMNEDKDACLTAVLNDASSFAYIPFELRDDYDICLAVVSKCGVNLRFVSRRLRDNFEICLAAVSKFGWSFCYVSQRLRNDRDICLAAVSNYGICFANIPLGFRDDHDICLAAVSNCESPGQSGAIFKLVSRRLRDDHDICLVAVSKLGLNLVHVSPRLKRNNQICLAAIDNDANILRYVSGLLNKNNVPIDTFPVFKSKGKYFSQSTRKVITIHNKKETTLSILCMKNCTKSVYGFPEEIQEMILLNVGSFETGMIKRKDRVGGRRRINFMDDVFSGDLYSIATLNK